MRFPVSYQMGGLPRTFLWVLVWMGLTSIQQASAQANVLIGGTGFGTLLVEKLLSPSTKLASPVNAKALMPPLGSNGGLRALDDGKIQIAIVTVPSIHSSKSDDKVARKVIPWITTPLVFTGQGLPAGTSISLEQIADIYAGRQAQWNNGKPIRLVTRSERESDTRILRAQSAPMDAAVMLSLKRQGLHLAENDFDAQQLLEKASGSFGSIGLGQLLLSDSQLQPAYLNNKAPSLENLQNKSYPLEKPLYLVISTAPNPATLRFIQHLQSPQVMQWVLRYGFVPLKR